MANSLRYFFLIFLGVSACAMPQNSQRIVPALTRGPYLQVLTPQSIVIRWRTDSATLSKVEFGTTLQYGFTETDSTITTEHVIQLKGLQPETRYYYTVGTETYPLAGDSSFYFQTAPPQGKASDVSVWVTGDFGVGSDAQRAVRDAFSAFTGNRAELWLWLGDNAYSIGSDQQYQDYVFDIYPEQLRHIPLFPSLGNHDYGQAGYLSMASLTTRFPYFSIFSTPQQGESGGVASHSPKYYSFNYANIHFISLDSYGSYNYPGSDMHNWLQSDLAANRQRWTIVYFHHPPYSKGTHDSDYEPELIDMRTNIVPLLEAYGVDLVLSGHSHTNERSYLIRGYYGLSGTFENTMKVSGDNNLFDKVPPFRGTVYAVCGTSGQNPGPPMADAPMPCMFFNDFSSNCSLVLDVQNELLTMKYLSSNSDILDSVVISKHGPYPVSQQGVNSCEIVYNPNGQVIYLDLHYVTGELLSAELVDTQGKRISTFENLPKKIAPSHHFFQLPLGNLSLTTGIYFFKVVVGNESYTRKFFFRKT